jgi:hypothetical protein
LDLRGRKWQAGENCIMRSFIVCTSPNIIRAIKSRRMRLECHVACMGKMRNSDKIFIRKPEGKRPLRRPRHR